MAVFLFLVWCPVLLYSYSLVQCLVILELIWVVPRAER